jgi:hypothetical protein
MASLLRDLERPNWIPPASPEIIRESDGIPSDAFSLFLSVNYAVQPWIFDAYTAPIPQEVAIIPNEERVPWSDDQRLPR